MDQNLNEIKQTMGDLVCEYEKVFKYILSHISYTIEEQLLIQWFPIGFLHKIREPLRMHEITTYNEALKKAQRIEANNDWNAMSIDKRLEKRIYMMYKTICDISLRNYYLWCTICMVEGHMKDTYGLREDKPQEV